MTQLSRFLRTVILFILFKFIMAGALIAQPFDGFIQFDGIDDQLNVDVWKLFPTQKSFTLEFWMRVCDGTPAYQTQALLHCNETIKMELDYLLPNMSLVTCTKNISSKMFCLGHKTDTVNLRWHHFAFVYNHYTGDAYGCLDGKCTVYSGQQASFSLQPFPTMAIGNTDYTSNPDMFYEGFMDELRFSDTIRYGYPTPSYAIPTGPFIVDKNTVGLWRFNDQTPTDSFKDESVNDSYLQSVGNPSISRVGPVIMSYQGDSFVVTDTFSQYRWVECKDHSQDTIPQENSFTYTPTYNGEFAVEGRYNGCWFRSNCMEITHLGNELLEPIYDLSISPNPIKNYFRLSHSLNKQVFFKMYQINGEIVYEGNLLPNQRDMHIPSLPRGIYMIKLDYEGHTSIQKIAVMY